MLKAGRSGPINDRLSSHEGGRFFFEPLQLHLQPADLLEQLGLAGLGVVRGGLGPFGEELLGPGQERLLPGVDERRVDIELPGQLVDGTVPLGGGQGDPGLERRRVDLPLACPRIPLSWTTGIA